MADLAKLFEVGEMLALARDGDAEKLARYIEEGREITPDVREVVAAILRGENDKPSHRTRTYEQKRKEHEAVHKVIMQAFSLVHQGKKVTRNALVELYLDQHPDANKNTILKWIENWEIESGQSFSDFK